MTSGAVEPGDLARSTMLGSLPSDALTMLAARCRTRVFAAGEAILEEGQSGDSMHVLQSGTAKVIHQQGGGRQEDIWRMTPGEVFGELAVLDPAPRSATVVAASPCTTVEVRRDDLMAVFDAHPEASRRMLGALARSLTYAREAVARDNRRLEETVRERTRELRHSQLEIVQRLGRAIDTRDANTGEHVVRMSRYVGRFAEALGMSPSAVELLVHAAPLHDIGKIGVPDAVLRKPGPLTVDERLQMEAHTTIGARMLEGSSSPLVREARQIALCHHERWDGSGYPRGLVGDEIPLSARISSISDVFDALMSVRPYKAAWSVDQAVAEIDAQRGLLFDPGLVDLFHELLPDLLELQDAPVS